MFSKMKNKKFKLNDTIVEIHFVYFFQLSQILENSENDIFTIFGPFTHAVYPLLTTYNKHTRLLENSQIQTLLIWLLSKLIISSQAT